MAEMKNSDKNGINRCPNCGASDVVPIAKTGKLKCNFCRSQFDGKKANARGGVDKLVGDTIGSGAADIIPSEKVIVTLKCPACGAEVVINTDEAVSARCHWCRHTLSLNEKMPNGAVPDLVLPFQKEKSEAEQKIRDFVMKRQFFAHPKFRREFTTENIMGVYMPYMIVDVNAHAEMKGEGEHLIRKYSTGSGNSRRTYYDAEAFSVTRDFDLLVDDLTIESSSERLQQDVRANTNNVINAIMPFDTENCVEWNPNFLHGYASERRDTNVGELKKQLDLQVGDIARYKVKETTEYYNRGVKWNSEEITTKGSKWKAAYLPVWLYSYLQDNGSKKMLHYVAVNARTGETMGSVPINKTRLFVVSAIIEIIGIFIGLSWMRIWIGIDVDDDNPFWLGLAGFTPGFIFYWIQCARYRNMNARHKHEAETPSEIKNVKKTDTSLGRRNRLSSSRIAGENDSIVNGVVAKAGEKMMGEKMANFIGIGRMYGSKPNETVVGQKAEQAAIAKRQARSAIITILVVMAVITMAIVAIGVFVSIKNSRKSEREYGSSSTSSFYDLKSDIRSWGNDNTAIIGTGVSEIAIYNRNDKQQFTEYELSSSDYNSALSLMVTEFNKSGKSKVSFVSNKAKALDKILTSDGLTKKKVAYVSGAETKSDYLLGLYTKKKGSEDGYIFCDMRESMKELKELDNSFTVNLRCIDIDAATIKNSDIAP